MRHPFPQGFTISDCLNLVLYILLKPRLKKSPPSIKSHLLQKTHKKEDKSDIDLREKTIYKSDHRSSDLASSRCNA